MSSTGRKNPIAERRLDLIFSALSDGTRRALLARLSQGPAIVSELAEPFDMTRMAVSKHLRVLERAHLIARSIDGRVHRCALSATPLRDVQHWLDYYRKFWEGTLDSLAQYVAQNPERRK